jgi:hypothetical protein
MSGVVSQEFVEESRRETSAAVVAVLTRRKASFRAAPRLRKFSTGFGGMTSSLKTYSTNS